MYSFTELLWARDDDDDGQFEGDAYIREWANHDGAPSITLDDLTGCNCPCSNFRSGSLLDNVREEAETYDLWMDAQAAPSGPATSASGKEGLQLELYWDPRTRRSQYRSANSGDRVHLAGQRFQRSPDWYNDRRVEARQALPTRARTARRRRG